MSNVFDEARQRGRSFRRRNASESSSRSRSRRSVAAAGLPEIRATKERGPRSTPARACGRQGAARYRQDRATQPTAEDCLKRVGLLLRREVCVGAFDGSFHRLEGHARATRVSRRSRNAVRQPVRHRNWNRGAHVPCVNRRLHGLSTRRLNSGLPVQAGSLVARRAHVTVSDLQMYYGSLMGAESRAGPGQLHAQVPVIVWDFSAIDVDGGSGDLSPRCGHGRGARHDRSPRSPRVQFGGSPSRAGRGSSGKTMRTPRPVEPGAPEARHEGALF